MQPYFFPYPGYFSLIKATNKWIVFDTPQFETISWMSRNRVIKPNTNEWMYFRVPVRKHKLNTPINEIQIQNEISWKAKIFAQLGHYKKQAPYYKPVVEFLQETLSGEFNYLVDINVHTLKLVCEYIGIEFNFELLSNLDIQLEPVRHPDEWALNICKALGYNSYINAEGGQSFFHKQAFQDNNIDLHFLEYLYPEYDQKTASFIPGISIIDVMMFNSPKEIRQLLNDYRLVK